MKKLILEIIIIIASGTVIALFYNYFSEKSIPLIPKTQKELTVNESDLDKILATSDSVKTPQASNSAISNKDTSKNIVNNSANQNEKAINNQTDSSKTKKIEIRYVTTSQVTKYLNNPKVQFIDARFDADDYKKSHIGNAINITPWKNGDLINFDDLLIKLPHNKLYIVYCDGGTCDDSKIVARRMLELGFNKVFVYADGWDEWSKTNK
jgi:rhodanese-related sulfurtransferase